MAVAFKKDVGRVTQRQAMAAPTAHRFGSGAGYTHCPPLPKLKVDLAPAGRASPPAGTADSSRHLLMVPGGGKDVPFTWVARQGAWMRPGGWRMAFAADYLSRAGWTYSGPVSDADPLIPAKKRKG